MTDDYAPSNEQQPLREPTLDIGNLQEIAIWIAQFIALSAASGVIGSTAYNYLKAWKQRFGSNKVKELEEAVYQELKRLKRKPNVSNQDLRNRAAALFRDFENH